jgi:hypothetical protein
MLMNVSHVVFRWIVAQVFLTRLIIKFEVFLCFTIQQPKVLHLHCMGMLEFDHVIEDANGSGVFEVNRCRCCGWPSFQEGKSQDLGFLSIDKECTELSVSGQGGNKFEDSACDVDGAIKFDGVTLDWKFAQEEVATGGTASTRGGEI